jgi:putative oxidoreductase
VSAVAQRVNDVREYLDSARPRRVGAEAAIVIVRVVLAWIFVYHGASTLFGAFHGPGLRAMANFFTTTAHLRPGMLFAVLNGVTELAGGVAVGVGLLPRLAASALLVDMVVAMATVTFKGGLVPSASGPGYELNIALAALAAVVVAHGAGQFTLDRLWSRARAPDIEPVG